MRFRLLSFFLMSALVSIAQEQTDSASVDKVEPEMEVKIGMSKLTRLTSERDEAVKKNKDLADSCRNLREQNRELEVLRVKYNQMADDYDKMKKAMAHVDTCLIGMASNFLYIPYEAYSIRQVAIPSFEAVSNKDLKIKYNLRLTLLKNYVDDVKALLDFIEECGKDLGKPFSSETQANRWIAKLKEESFYKRYLGYNDWRNTYLGKKIDFVEKKLKAFNGNSHKFDCDAIKLELSNCLKTEEDL